MNHKKMNHKEAEKKAFSILEKMSPQEKITMVGGVRGFFIPSNDRLGIPEVFMSDASGGVNIRETWLEDRVDTDLEKSVAFPCLLQLAATWNPELCGQYASSIGEECRAGGIHFLLGPGMNIYRHAQCGRNFEYLGEDPFLASRFIEKYVIGLQNTGVAATLKHFAANNSDYYRRKSNSIVGKRALHEIYLPAFQAGIDAGAVAVMTAYNLINDEWCSQNEDLIKDLLRREMGFQWLVMTDWWAINDCGKAVKSGLDLEMPALKILKKIPELLEPGEISMKDLDRMVLNILKTCIAMDFYNRDFQKKEFLNNYSDHEAVALQTAREGIVLLRNREALLPLNDQKKILLTGRFVNNSAQGGGASEVEGFNHITLLQALQADFADSLTYIENPSDLEIEEADVLIVSTGTLDSEGYDRAFELPETEENRVKRMVSLNSNTVVIVSAGGGIRMTGWNDDSAAILYSWYGGQAGNQALADIISGRINPSGKLPITIEKEFADSPGADYIPRGEELYHDWDSEGENAHAVFDVNYAEDIFVGYRWYERRNVEPLYHFGFGLSYSKFELQDLSLSHKSITGKENLEVSVRIKNVSTVKGQEIIQLYVRDKISSVPRPVKELKAFKKIELDGGEETELFFTLEADAFSYWNPESESWKIESGDFLIYAGTSSSSIDLSAVIELK